MSWIGAEYTQLFSYNTKSALISESRMLMLFCRLSHFCDDQQSIIIASQKGKYTYTCIHTTAPTVTLKKKKTSIIIHQTAGMLICLSVWCSKMRGSRHVCSYIVLMTNTLQGSGPSVALFWEEDLFFWMAWEWKPFTLPKAVAMHSPMKACLLEWNKCIYSLREGMPNKMICNYRDKYPWLKWGLENVSVV